MLPLFCTLLVTLSSVAAYEYILKEKTVPPHGWSRIGSPPAEHTIKLQIGLQQSNFGVLEQHLLEVSDRMFLIVQLAAFTYLILRLSAHHSRYGQYLSKEEVESHIRPHDDALAAVDEWLESHDIDLNHSVSRSDAKDWVILDAPVRLVEKLLNTSYSVWQHSSGQNIVRTTQYHLPAQLHRHIDVIQPTTSFSLFKSQKVTYAPDIHEDKPSLVNSGGKALAANGNRVNISCNSTITPSCLYDLYGVHYNGSAHTKNSIGTTGFLENYFNLTDLNAFYKAYVPAALGTPVDIIEISGGINNQSELRAEAELDTQYAFGLAHPAANTFYTMGGRPPFHIDNFTIINSNEPYQEWINYLLSRKQKDLPLIISTSYGDDEQTVPRSYAKRVCAGFAQLGARGISMLFSTGDYGVGDGESDPSKVFFDWKVIYNMSSPN
jgi:tripeptidyl-peptidase-1